MAAEKSGFRRALSMWALYAKMDFHWFTQDTFCCSLCILSDFISSAASISGVFLLSQRFAGVGGWSADEVLWMLGFFTLADGFTAILFGGGNILNISRRVGRGQVDHMLIQPSPLWLQLLTDGFMPVSGNAGFITGLALTWVASARLGILATPAWLGSLALCLICVAAIRLGLSFLAGATAFYRPAACEEISSLAIELMGTLGKYPLAGLPSGVTAVLVTVAPVGLMAWWPSAILLGKTGGAALLLPACVGAVLCALATYFFRRGLRHYAIYGCNRYRAMGHRN